MHAAFIPYGNRHDLEIMFRDIEAQKLKMPIHSPDGLKREFLWCNVNLRQLPFGVYEIIFPKEQKDVVLNTLFKSLSHTHYKGIYRYLGIIRRILKLKKIPEFDKSHNLIWTMKNVGIFPVGIREDGELSIINEGKYKGWKYEAQ